MNQNQALETLDRYVRARYPIVAIQSHEEARVLNGIKSLCNQRNYALMTWSVTEGMVGAAQQDSTATKDPIPAFEVMLKANLNRADNGILYVMKDLHGLMGSKARGFDPVISRYLRDVAARFEAGKATLVLLSPEMPVPPDLEKVISLMDWPLPDYAELETILQKAERRLPEDFPVTINGNRERLIQTMCGLTTFEANTVLAAGIVATRQLGDDIIPYVVSEKAQIIKKSGVLEFFETDVTMNQLGGLQHLKQYAAIKRAAFSAEAAAEGVDTPRGVLLVGIPGTGKSLAAKAIAGGQLPLLRMDVGALMGGLVGESESNMRAALKTAEAVAPCVLWVDEVEKSIGGGGGELDGGTSARVFGTLLTWMQETKSPVYVVATANNFGQIKKEMVRRFDDVFWVDLPNQASRVEILRIHLVRRKKAVDGIDLEPVARACWSYSGAEIEKVVKAAIEQAFFEHAPLSTARLLAAARQIVPLYRSSAAAINQMRSQIDDVRQASDPLEPQPEEKAEAMIDLS